MWVAAGLTALVLAVRRKMRARAERRNGAEPPRVAAAGEGEG
ncbi:MULTISPECIES: hypothetical protein [Streptomyces]|nr:hypothetical protein [Streptomyces sp. NEAU-383]